MVLFLAAAVVVSVMLLADTVDFVTFVVCALLPLYSILCNIEL